MKLRHSPDRPFGLAETANLQILAIAGQALIDICHVLIPALADDLADIRDELTRRGLVTGDEADRAAKE